MISKCLERGGSLTVRVYRLGNGFPISEKLPRQHSVQILNFAWDGLGGRHMASNCEVGFISKEWCGFESLRG